MLVRMAGADEPESPRASTPGRERALKLVRFSVRALRVTASTIAVVALLKAGVGGRRGLRGGVAADPAGTEAVPAAAGQRGHLMLRRWAVRLAT